jgi:protein-S-isoprenylcysteine O-methyltransferase Ste14
MVLGYALVFAGASLVVEGWRAIHRARKEDRLVSSGVYARVRHPQYSGLFLIVFGDGIVHWPTIVSVVAFPVIVAAYTLLARKEERRMLEKHGDAYRLYQRQVPMFIPRLRAGRREAQEA